MSRPLAPDVLLLGLDPTTGRRTVPRDALDLAVTAAAVVDLVEAGVLGRSPAKGEITDAPILPDGSAHDGGAHDGAPGRTRRAPRPGRLFRTDAPPPETPVLAELARLAGGRRPTRILAKFTEDGPVEALRSHAQDWLAAEGAVEPTTVRRLAVLRTVVHPVLDASIARGLREDVAAVVNGRAPEHQRSITLAALLAPLRLTRPLIEPTELPARPRELRAREKELRRAHWIGPALHKALDDDGWDEDTLGIALVGAAVGLGIGLG